MMTSFYHYNDLTDRRAAVSFLYLSHGLAWVSHMGKNNRNLDLVCEKIISKQCFFVYLIQRPIRNAV